MQDQSRVVPVILLDGYLASGISIISDSMGTSYSFTVINGNQYLRDLGDSTGYVTSPVNTIDHERQLLNFYEYIVKDGVAVHDQMYSFLTSKASIAKVPTIIHCTGFAAYAFTKQVPVKQVFWLHASLDDRVNRLFHRAKIQPTEAEVQEFKEKLAQLDELWSQKLKNDLGVDMAELQKKKESVIDTTNLSVDEAFQKLATIDSFIDSYNSFGPLLPDFAHEWRRWKCLNCQLVTETNKILIKCPRCGNADPNKFQDL